MKHLKTYEQVKEPQVGDYVLFYFDQEIGDKIFRNFANSNIGQLVDISNPTVARAKFKNMSDEMLYRFGLTKKSDGSVNISLPKSSIIRHSKNKEDLETYMAANKYNI
jgi:hypothetical protein